MSDSELYRIVSRLEQRMSNVIRVGRIASVQDSPPRVKVEYDKDSDGNAVLSAWLCYFEERQGYMQTWNPPEVGEQCMILSPSGDLRLGKVLLGLNTTDNAPISTDSNIHKIKFKDGSTFEFDRSASQWTISLGSGNAEFTGTLFTFNTDLQVNGNITATKTITGNMVYDKVSSMVDMRATYNGHTHNGKVSSPGSQM